MVASTRFAFFNSVAGRRWLALVGLGVLASQCQPSAPPEQPAQAAATSPDSLKPRTAAAAPAPKFDVEGPIMRQLALLPPAERQVAPATMRRYQQLTRRFWLSQYWTEHLLKQAQLPQGPPSLTAFTYQLTNIQWRWRTLHEDLSQHPPLPTVMADHLARMQQVGNYQQAALTDLQADCAAQRPPQPDAATLAGQRQVKKLLAPLLREPKALEVHVN